MLSFLVALLVVSCKPVGDGAESTAPAVADPPTATAHEEPPSERDARHNVLLISVDTLRADHLSLYGYPRPTTPAIDRFFANAEVYDRAYAPEANTSPSVIRMLSGLYPARHGLRLFYQLVRPSLPLLPDLLRQVGFQTAAVVSNVVLTDEAIGLGRRFDYYDDFVDEGELSGNFYQRRASRTTEAALRWLRERRAPGRPHLLWVHYMDPHAPYTPPANELATDFRHDEPLPIDTGRVGMLGRLPKLTDGREYIDRYDEEIAYADREIGRLLKAYTDLGLAERTLFLFTADHGETMVEHEVYFSHGYHVWEAIMHIPLALRRPGGEPRRRSHPA